LITVDRIRRGTRDCTLRSAPQEECPNVWVRFGHRAVRESRIPLAILKSACAAGPQRSPKGVDGALVQRLFRDCKAPCAIVCVCLAGRGSTRVMAAGTMSNAM